MSVLPAARVIQLHAKIEGQLRRLAIERIGEALPAIESRIQAKAGERSCLWVEIVSCGRSCGQKLQTHGRGWCVVEEAVAAKIPRWYGGAVLCSFHEEQDIFKLPVVENIVELGIS